MSREPLSPVAAETRVLILAPTVRDAAICESLLLPQRIGSVPCADVSELRRQMAVGAAAVVASESVLAGAPLEELAAALERQPSWSDLPVLLLTSGGSESPVARTAVRRLRNVLLLGRPVQLAAFGSAVRMAVRARLRQYEMRDQFEALRRSEATLQAFYDSSPYMMGIAELTLNDEIVAVRGNPVVARFFGADSRKLAERRGSELGTPAEIEALWRRAYRQSAESGAPVQFEYEHPHPAGPVWLRATVTPLGRGVSGRPQFSFLAEDFTERRRGEEALRQSEARFRLLHESQRDGFVRVDMSGRIIESNEIYREMLGYTEEELYAATYVALTPARWHAAEAKIVEEQILARGYSDIYEKEYRRKDGTLIPVELRTVLVRDPAGEPSAMWAVVRDIRERKQAEEALRASEQRFKRMANAAPAMLWISDERHACTFISQAWQAYTGLETTAGLGFGWLEAMHPGDRARAEGMFLDAAGRRESCALDYRLRRRDGAYRWVMDAGRPQYDDAGRFVGYIGAIFDVHERREAELALRESEERFRGTFENVAVGIAHVGLDGRWLRVNERTCAITGYTRDELLRTTFMQITHPDDVERDWEHARRLLAGEIHTYSIEKRYMRKDGASVPIELTVSLARTPAGEPNYFISVIQEIEERARAEQALRESEERFRTLADNISQFAWMADAQGALFWYNRRWYDFTGTTFDEMQGWGWQKVHHPEHVQRVVEKFRGHIERGEVWEDTFPLRGKDGAYRWFLSRAVPIRDAAGRVVRWFGTNTDITELREVEQRRDELLDSERAARSEAERAARVKDEFLATLSHELRTPLAAILGWAQIVRRGRLAGEDINDAFKIIEDNARLQKQLIEDLLDMSRIASGKMKIDAQPVNLATVAEEAVAMIRPAAEEKGLRLVTRLDGSGGNVLGDAGRLKQVIGNLLSNAVKFTPAGGQIRVVLHHKAGRALLAVRDTGIGMAPEFVPQLFERFRQADASSTRKYRGLGLGLALVRQLTELHGGTVRATSRGAGRGSTFVIEMPLLRGLTPPQRAEAAAQVAFDFDLRHVAALVVDDEPTTRALITRILKEAGAAVTDCPGAAEALEAMAARTYDVIVSDISMPGIDGYMLLREVRSLPDRERALIPAVAVTAFSRDDDRRRAYEAGYQTHLTKPIEPAELCAIVANLVRREAASPDRA